ncbi:MAG: accessory Sec system translocase SecA2, partial [Lachnospiraceae bacterium]|nr:accessory Sec system translocase SecA2 [Lachnospiraceae bacterium]
LAARSRKQAMEYDQVLRCQRNLIYKVRDRLLEGEGVNFQKFQDISRGNIRRFLASGPEPDVRMLNRYILDHISYRLDEGVSAVEFGNPDAVEAYLMKRVEQGLKEQKQKVGSEKRMADFLRTAALQAIDDGWVEQVDYLQQMQAAVAGRASAQRDLLFEFQKDALESWKKMEITVLNNIMRNILLGNVYTDAEDRLRILLP